LRNRIGPRWQNLEELQRVPLVHPAQVVLAQ
jgi:hypothetical protein